MRYKERVFHYVGRKECLTLPEKNVVDMAFFNTTLTSLVETKCISSKILARLLQNLADNALFLKNLTKNYQFWKSLAD